MMIPCEVRLQYDNSPRRGWLLSMTNNSNDTRVLVAYDDNLHPTHGWSKGSLALAWVEPRQVRILRTQISVFDAKPATARASVASPDGAKAPAVVTAAVNHKAFCTPDRCYCGPQ